MKTTIRTCALLAGAALAALVTLAGPASAADPTAWAPVGTTVPTWTNMGGFVPTCTNAGCAGSVSLAQYVRTESRCYSGASCNYTPVDVLSRFSVTLVESFACAAKSNGALDRDRRATLNSGTVFTPLRPSKMPVSGNVQAKSPVWLHSAPSTLTCLPTQAPRRTGVVITPLTVETEGVSIALTGQPPLVAPSWTFAFPNT